MLLELHALHLSAFQADALRRINEVERYVDRYGKRRYKPKGIKGQSIYWLEKNGYVKALPVLAEEGVSVEGLEDFELTEKGIDLLEYWEANYSPSARRKAAEAARESEGE